MSAPSAPEPRPARRGTTRDPGPDLYRLPIGLDLSGISVAEGLRAALASAVFLVVARWVGSPALLIAASAAMITCFCDVGGNLAQRLPMLLSFTVLGATTWAAFGLLRAVGLPAVVPAAAAGVFLFSMARVWGLRAQTVGNILIVVLALAIDKPLTPPGAGLLAAAFVAGGLWASVLTLVIWRVQSDRPAARAVEQVWRRLEALTADLRALLRADAPPEAWDAHARGHRRGVRAAIEDARSLAAGSIRSRDLLSGRGTTVLLLLDLADQLFGELIVLAGLLEADEGTGVRADADRLLRRLRPVLLLLSFERSPDPDRLRASLDNMIRDMKDVGSLRTLADAVVDSLRVVTRVLDGDLRPNLRAETVAREGGVLAARLWGPLRDELTWGSAILRHAARATAVTTPAVALSLVWWTPYAHWLTITVALTMQPFFAATWQRALERVGGTVVGAGVGAALSLFPDTPLATAALLIPLSILGFSVRQVSYGAYIACLTPLVVAVFDLAEPGSSGWVTAGMRTLYTLVGGVAAVAACTVLWPTWEPNRLERDLRATLLAYRALAVSVLGRPEAAQADRMETARRAAGLANSNLEASLARALQEPGRKRHAALDRIIAADALLRRLGAAMLAVPHDAAVADALTGEGRDRWRAWLDGAFAAVAEGRTPSEPAPDGPAAGTLQRLRRGLDVLARDVAGSGILR